MCCELASNVAQRFRARRHVGTVDFQKLAATRDQGLRLMHHPKLARPPLAVLAIGQVVRAALLDERRELCCDGVLLLFRQAVARDRPAFLHLVALLIHLMVCH